MAQAQYILTAKGGEMSDNDKGMEQELKDAKARIASLEATANDSIMVPADNPKGLHSMFKAIIAGMSDEDSAMSKGMKGMDDDMKQKIAKVMKAMEKTFDQDKSMDAAAEIAGILTEPSTKVTEESKAKTAQLIATITTLENKAKLPIINKILTAKTLTGASEDIIKADNVRLTAMSLSDIESEYAVSNVFIEKALSAKTAPAQINTDTSAAQAALNASVQQEHTFDFNGVSNQMGALTGKEIDIDSIMEGTN